MYLRIPTHLLFYGLRVGRGGGGGCLSIGTVSYLILTDWKSSPTKDRLYGRKFQGAEVETS